MHVRFARCLALPALFAAVATLAHAAGPCTGPTALFSQLNRPTFADSACVAPPQTLLVESGFRRAIGREPTLDRQNRYPHVELRYGLGSRWEIDLFPPNAFHSVKPVAGLPGSKITTGIGDVTIGAKRYLGTAGPLSFAMDGYATLPSGDSHFSRGAVTGKFRAMIHFKLGAGFGGAVQLGVANEAYQVTPGGSTRRFTEFNPDGVFKYTFPFPLQLYGEVYRNNIFGSNLRAATVDGGVRYLVTPWWELDVEAGRLISGPAGYSSHYFSAGLGLRVG